MCSQSGPGFCVRHQACTAATAMKMRLNVTWSPRLRPTSAALLPGSTASMKMRKPFSWPPRRLKARGESLDGLVRVTSRGLALAAHAMFNSLRCPHIFWKGIKSWYDSSVQWMATTLYLVTNHCAAVILTSFSRLFSNSSRKWVIAGSPSKSLKWLFTHSKITRVTWRNHMISTCQHTVYWLTHSLNPTSLGLWKTSVGL